MWPLPAEAAAPISAAGRADPARRPSTRPCAEVGSAPLPALGLARQAPEGLEPLAAQIFSVLWLPHSPL